MMAYDVESTSASDETEATPAAKVAVLPFLNTAQFAHGIHADLAAANNTVQKAIRTMGVPNGMSVLPPEESQSRMSSQEVTHEYAVVIRDYVTTGLIDSRKMQTLMMRIGATVVIQGVLESLAYARDGRHIRSIGVRFLCFGKNGTIDWNVHTSGALSAFDDRQVRRQVGQENMGLGLLGGVLLVGGFGVMGGGVAAAASRDMEGFLGLILGGTAVSLAGVVPLHLASKDDSVNESVAINGMVTFDEAIASIVGLAMTTVSRRLHEYSDGRRVRGH
ncbi:MAG: hypothetical protein HY744_05015 [Deltaproteobacteria bacterium]|nr:hypothetical protein [Deltaproteobacteria bacterium]